MTRTILVVGLDGSASGGKALDFAEERAKALGDCLIIACYVVEWSPFTFQTPEENEQRHKRREEEIKIAHARVLDPAIADAKAAGLEIEGHVFHGDAADILDDLAVKRGASQIIIGRVGARGLKERLFGGVAGRLVASASVPVTIIP